MADRAPYAVSSPSGLEDGLVHVVDDFYGDPDAVRHLALRADYLSERPDQGYAGAESAQPFYTAALAERFASLVQRPIVVKPERNIFGRFRIALSDSRRPTKVHCDLGVDWTAVVYLTPEAPEEGGLGIYRHRPTGLALMPSTDEEARAHGFADRADIDRRVVLADSLDESKWEEIGFCEMRYNRLVLFRGCRLFHAANEVFGNDRGSGRLSQHFFFDEEHP